MNVISSPIKFQGVESRVAAGLLEAASIRVALAVDLPNQASSALSDIPTIDWVSGDVDASFLTTEPNILRWMIEDVSICAEARVLGPFRYIIFYDDASPNKSPLFFYDYSSELTLRDGEVLKVEFDLKHGAFTLPNILKPIAA